MDFLSLALKLGSFLIILPYLSMAQLVTISMPQYAATNSEIRVKCDFTGFTSSGLLKMILHFGTSMASVYYAIGNGKYTLDPTPGITFETGSGTTVQEGSITFVFSRIGCDKFTAYYCQGDGKSVIKSSNRTLQARPQIQSIEQTPRSLLTVNEISTFTCRGTISTEGSFFVQWYRNTITINNKLQAQEAQVIRTNQCARTLSSTLNYNVSQFDYPNLLLWCLISAQQKVQQSANFSVQGMSTVAVPITPQTSKAGLDPGSIVGIVLGITATIILIVLLVWFLVVRPKRRAEAAAKEQGPEPNAKDYQVQDNVLYATVDPSKKQNYKSSSSSLAEEPDTNSNSVQDTRKAPKKQKSNKRNAFLPSHGDATDNMDEAYELPPPPPPPPKPHYSPNPEEANPLHYAELELAVHKSAKRRSEYGRKPNTDYAVITYS